MQAPVSADLALAAATWPRRPSVKLYVLWNGTDLVDETAYVLEGTTISGTSEGGAIGVGITAAAGGAETCTFTLRNDTKRFSAGQGGALDAYIAADGGYGKKISVLAGFITADGDAEHVVQFNGYLKEPEETTRPDLVRYTAQGFASRVSQHLNSSALSTNHRADEYITHLSVEIYGAPVFISDYGAEVYPFLWSDSESIWSEMQQIAKAEGGRVFFDNGGILRFHNYLHLAQQTTAQATFTGANFRDLKPSFDFENIRNHIIVKYRPRYVGSSQVIWTCSEPVEVPPGAQVVRWAQLQQAAYDVVQPATIIDWSARTSSYIDKTADITVSVGVQNAQSVKVLIDNANTASTLYVTPLQLRGFPILSTEERTVEELDQDSIDLYGDRVESIDNVYIQNDTAAQALAASLLHRYKLPRKIVTCTIIKGSLPWLETGDRVHIDDSGATGTGVHGDFFVAGIDWSISQALYNQNLTLVDARSIVPYPDPDVGGDAGYFYVGQDDAHSTELGVLGRFFW